MERPYFFPDQLVLDEDLNEIIEAVSLEIKRRAQGSLGDSGGWNESSLSTYKRGKAGIMGSPGESSSNKNFKVTYGLSSDQLIIYSGSALDVNGELIYIDSTQTLNKGVDTVNYNWVSTTGINYVKLSYIETSGSVKTDDLGNGYFTRYQSSWFIKIDDVIPTNDEILLATFTGDGGGNVTPSSIVDTRLYTRVYTFADAVGLDPYNTPINTHLSVGDHIRATGSSTPTSSNPHGLSFDDIGGSTRLLRSEHATDIHVNCIISFTKDPTSINSYLGVVTSPSSGAHLVFNSPSNAVMYINGVPFSGSISNLYASDAYNINGDGVYYAVVDSSGNPSWIPQSQESTLIDTLFTTTVSGLDRWSTGHKNKNYYILGRATVADNGDDITLWVDSRIFYGTHQLDIGADYDETILDPNAGGGALNRTSTLITNLARIRHQLGRAINGSASLTSWKSTSYPLTAGPSSNGDPYHRHYFDNLQDVSPTNVTISKLEELVEGDTSFSLFGLSEDMFISFNTPTALLFNPVIQGSNILLLDNAFNPVLESGSLISVTEKGWYDISAHAYLYNYGYGGGDEFGSGVGYLILNTVQSITLNPNGLTRDFIDPLKLGFLKCSTKVLLDPDGIDSPYSCINATIVSLALNHSGNPTSVVLKQKMSDFMTVGNLNPWYSTFISIRKIKSL